MTSTVRKGARAGFTLFEALFAMSIMAVVLLGSWGMLHHDARLSHSAIGISVAETRAQAMLFGLERELADARGANPIAQLTQTLGPTNTAEARVASTLGFPPQGRLLLSRGTGQVERLSYTSIDANRFLGLSRGEQCTSGATHAAGGEVLWGGLAEPIELQTNPAASLWDGRAQIGGRTVFYRGDGAGFSFRVPTDPAGGNDFLDGEDLRWGSTVLGVPTLDGWSALVFQPKDVFDESVTGEDVNRDGDRVDVFDVGQLRRITWNAAAPGAPGDDLGIGPSCVLQERCRWGGDLDHDGFDDPLFLWDATRRELSIRLFIIGRSVVNQPVVRKVESTIFLRNVAQG